ALLAADPADAEARLLLGLARGALGETATAADLLHAVARARPDCAHPCHDLAGLLDRLGLPAQATAQYRAALALAPEDGGLRRVLATRLLRDGDPGGALAALGDPAGSAASLHLAGQALAEAGDIPAATARFRRAVALDPGSAAGWSNLGMMLKTAGKHAAAIAAHDHAVERAPDEPQLHVNRAVALLHAGRWTEAWGEYEWRLRLPGHTPLPLDTLLPSLATGIDLAGRTVLLTHEEGFGDTLQFVRYAPLLEARGARVLLAVPGALARLLAPLGPIVAPSGTPPAFDFHCPFFSLPRVFAATPDTIPASVPYLTADPAKTATWRARLADGGPGLRVGLVWAGQARPWLDGFATLDGRRSAGLAAFAPLAGLPGVRFVSLQAGAAAAEARPAGLDLLDPMGSVVDFADTAAIVAALDLVVSVDTAVVHLAGGLGTPVFLLDRYDNCWRWLSGRADSPWYPGLRIFRQTRLGDWSGPMAQVAAALAALGGAWPGGAQLGGAQLGEAQPAAGTIR
ncbi:MAG: tetratricopeptide repeat protein, partial [Proteobacteria bacterium]|nr:tetratricopeptide repeat protein [Pseudomonadota bacterium]